MDKTANVIILSGKYRRSLNLDVHSDMTWLSLSSEDDETVSPLKNVNFKEVVTASKH